MVLFSLIVLYIFELITVKFVKWFKDWVNDSSMGLICIFFKSSRSLLYSLLSFKVFLNLFNKNSKLLSKSDNELYFVLFFISFIIFE